MKSWDVSLYHRLEKERTRPSEDLVKRIEKEKVKTILDIGCGSGMSTMPLIKRWPDAKVTGVDLSETMLEKAKEMSKQVEWICRDCNESLQDLGTFDLIFANASLQWLNNHEAIPEDWCQLLNPGGMIAVQIPLFLEMGVQKSIEEVCQKNRWFPYFEYYTQQLGHCHTASEYYNILHRYKSTVEMWETDYYHVLKGYEGIVEFYQSTGLRPYLAALREEYHEPFLEDLKEQLKHYYPLQEDGKVLFVFKRLFWIAY